MDASISTVDQQKLIRHENLIWLIVAQGIVILPLLIKLPIWLWLLWLGALIWRLKIHTGKLHFPSSTVKFLLSAFCLVGLFISFRGSYGVESMVGFLVFTFILKLLELRSRQDGLLMLLISFIAVAAQFLFAQSIGAALYASISCIVLVATWHTIYLNRSLTVQMKVSKGFILLLQSLPLMIVMFILMPRLGPLWRTPLIQHEAHTGFSDSLSPGDIGELVRDKGIAFRVNFLVAPAPANSEMYWRGLVLDDFDGRSWKVNKNWRRNGVAKTVNVSPDDILTYEIIVEPHYYQWLFSLSTPINIKTGRVSANITTERLIATRRPLTAQLQYTVQSVNPSLLEPTELTAIEQAYFTRLPANKNPRTVELAQRWLKEGLNPEQIVNKALAWYRQDFYYTLQPPLLGENSVDEFLFSSKQGFCEHFASSFSVLMRAAKVPTRVVVGYQGGTYNELENYWMVRQADAHAWAEVWIEGTGWKRVDPTSAVAPQRVQQGIDNALNSSERTMVAAGQFNAPQWLTSLRYRFDAANYMWSRWVLSYNAETQDALLKKLLGGTDPLRIGLVTVSIIVLLLILYTLLVIRPKWRTRTAFQRALKKFDKTCLQWKIKRQSHETIAQFAMRLATEQPTLKASCENLAHISQEVLYGNESQSQAMLINTLIHFPSYIIPKELKG